MRTYVIGIVLSLAIGVGTVRAEPLPTPTTPTELATPSEVTTAGGSKLQLPAGFVIVPPDWWAETDREMRRLQEQETRLKAENDSMRKSLRETGLRWYWIGGALATGFAAGLAYEAVR